MYGYIDYCVGAYYCGDFDIPELIEVVGFDVALNNSSSSEYLDHNALLHYLNCSVALPMCRSPTNVFYN